MASKSHMIALFMALVALTLVNAAPARFSAEYAPKLMDQGKCCLECQGTKNKYFSIADDSGPWLCGETCIRDSFFPIFHIFEKNLTKASWTNTPCADAGYTLYNQTVTHGGGGLYCTLDLYACSKGDGNCAHP